MASLLDVREEVCRLKRTLGAGHRTLGALILPVGADAPGGVETVYLIGRGGAPVQVFAMIPLSNLEEIVNEKLVDWNLRN